MLNNSLISVKANVSNLSKSELLVNEQKYMKNVDTLKEKNKMIDRLETREKKKVDSGLGSFDNEELVKAKLQIQEMENIGDDIDDAF